MTTGPSFRVFLAAAAVTLAFAPRADAVRWMIPASAHANGANGAKFRTDLTIDNPTASAASVAITVLAADVDNATLPTPVTKSVAAGAQLELGDVVDTLFGRSGGGSILVESSTDGLVVASRTYNQLPDRTFGMFLPGLRVESALQPGQTGHLVFLAKSDVYRSNVGFAGTTGTAGTATVRLYGGAGELLGTVSKPVFGWGQTQINDVFAAAGAAATTVARAEITATVPLFVYATVIDNRTGDPFPLLALLASDAGTDLVLTAAAHAAGANGSNFRSDLRIFNTTDQAGSVTLALYPRGASTPTPEMRTIPISGHQLLALDDVLLATFGKDSTAGALRITSTRPVLAISRTYNVASDGSTSGQELPAIPVSGYIAPGDVARLAGISSANARTNLIFFNASSASIALTIDFHSTGGAAAAASTTTTLPPQSMTQIDRITDALSLPSGSTGYLEIRAQSADASARYWVLATVIDLVSNDPFHVGPSVERAMVTTGECISIGQPPLNKTYVYRLMTALGTDTVEQTYLDYSNTTGKSRYVRKGTTNQDLTITATWHVMDHLIDVDGETQAGSQGLTASFSPALVSDPYDRVCQGQTWDIPSVTQTATLSTGTFSSQTTPASAVVLSVHESVTVPAGTFDTFHFKKTFTSHNLVVLIQEFWRNHADNVDVKWTSVDASGTATQELTGTK